MIAEVERICSSESRGCALREIAAEVRESHDARQAEITRVDADFRAAAKQGDLGMTFALRKELRQLKAAAQRELGTGAAPFGRKCQRPRTAGGGGSRMTRALTPTQKADLAECRAEVKRLMPEALAAEAALEHAKAARKAAAERRNACLDRGEPVPADVHAACKSANAAYWAAKERYAAANDALMNPELGRRISDRARVRAPAEHGRRPRGLRGVARKLTSALTPSMRAELKALRAQEPALLAEALEYQDWHDAAYSEWIQSIRYANAHAAEWTGRRTARRTPRRTAPCRTTTRRRRPPCETRSSPPQKLVDCRQRIAYLTEPEYAENRAEDIADELAPSEAELGS